MSSPKECKGLIVFVLLTLVFFVFGITAGLYVYGEIKQNVPDFWPAFVISVIGGIVGGLIAVAIARWLGLHGDIPPGRDPMKFPPLQAAPGADVAGEKEQRAVAYQAYIGFAQQAEANSWNRLGVTGIPLMLQA